MGDFLLGIGFLLAILGPLLLVPVTWLLYRFVAWPVVRRAAPPAFSPGWARLLALALSIVVVAATVVLSYLPGRWEYDRLCAQHATPVISSQVKTDGFYRTRLYPYEARKYLVEGPFAFVEAPDMYKNGVYLRYSRAAESEIHSEPVPGISSAYGVRETFSQLPGSIMMTEKVVYEIASDRELARAAHIVYQGGPLSLFLGAYAMSSCPDIRSEEGSRHFRTFYELESIVLRAEPGP